MTLKQQLAELDAREERVRAGAAGRPRYRAFAQMCLAQIARERAELHALDVARDSDEFNDWAASQTCQHDWQEQPGEPPVDVCSSCGEVRR